MYLQSANSDPDAVHVPTLERRQELQELSKVLSPDVVLSDQHTERRPTGQLPALGQECQVILGKQGKTCNNLIRHYSNPQIRN